MDDLLRRTLGEHIELALAPERALPLAMIDPPQLESAVLNLCINARDAMPQGGRLTIETAGTHLDPAHAAQDPGAAPGRHVTVVVSDNGCGIPRDVLPRVFEPFFTTKETGQGSGLGLAMVYGFIKQSGGHIRIDSEVDRGTSVQLYLPCAAEESEERANPPAAAHDICAGETVLLVEDDDAVRELTQNLLVNLGYRVLAAENGPEALAAALS